MCRKLLAEVAIQQTLEGLAVTSLVASHLVDGVPRFFLGECVEGFENPDKIEKDTSHSPTSYFDLN